MRRLQVTQSMPSLRMLFSAKSPAALASKAVICATSARLCGQMMEAACARIVLAFGIQYYLPEALDAA